MKNKAYPSDVFISLEKRTSTWEKLFNRLGSFYDARFHGTGWREKEKEFWEQKMKTRF